jgi:cobalt-zinc-cadmium efflux system outer membrane protein
MRHRCITGVGAILLLASLYGSSMSHAGESSPKSGPPGREFPSHGDTLTLLGALEMVLSSHGDTLTLRDALSLAILGNPELASVSWERRAAEANALQQGLFPNPELDVEVENMGGKNSDGTFGASETTILLSQLIETGGKRGKRSRVAGLGADLAGWDYESKRLDILSETGAAFVDVLASQERAALARETFHLADRIFDVVAERVKAGKVSPLEESKASVSRSLSEIRMQKAERELDAAIKRLASYWGSSSPSFTAVRGELDIPESIPASDDIDSLVALNPEIARWTTEIDRHRAALALERARRIPDLTLSGGVRRFEETEDTMFLFGLSIPIPIFDRNQGGVEEARFTLERAGEDRRAADVRIRTELSEAFGALSSAHSEALVLKTIALPSAEQAFTAAREGYRQGKFGFLEVLDAQKTYAEVRYQYIESLVAYHGSITRVERLIGRSLDTTIDQETRNEGESR